MLFRSSEAESAPRSDRTGALMSVESEVACRLSRPKSSDFVKTGMRLDTVRVSVRTQLRQADSPGSDRRGEIPDIAEQVEVPETVGRRSGGSDRPDCQGSMHPSIERAKQRTMASGPRLASETREVKAPPTVTGSPRHK